jgi:ABC-type lipoprotein export system ATPase subunit
MSLARALETITIGDLLARWPFAATFLAERGVELPDDPDKLLTQHVRGDLFAELGTFLAEMESFLSDDEEPVHEITIFGGFDKKGEEEPVRELVARVGEVICIVGPTGSGKSRLLADIEWVARRDTPTGRKVLINGEEPEDKWRTSSEHKLVAQLSQNMNFVMDLSVIDFLHLHAESRQVTDPEEKIAQIIEDANALAGEPFTPETPITSLSGGQSRALMIADTAVLSRSPVVLIDEIENAGIDRQRALDILIGQDKIVLMATHDPILALMGDRRVVINHGAMVSLVEPSEKERSNLVELRALDERMMRLRHRLRMGERLDTV